MPTICLYNLEQNLIIYHPKDNGDLNKLPDMTTNYIFRGLSGCSEVTQSEFVKPNKLSLYQKFVQLIQIFFVLLLLLLLGTPNNQLLIITGGAVGEQLENDDSCVC